MCDSDRLKTLCKRARSARLHLPGGRCHCRVYNPEMQSQKVLRATFAAALGLAAAQAQPAESKTAEQVYKNITALKGTPADQLIPAMQFIASSLGVECGTCHVQGKPEADDKPAKKTARNMIAMTLAINKDSFGGRTQITCYSCHRGAERPVGIPPVLESDAAPRPASGTPAERPQPANAETVLERYTAAVGGADAIKKVTSRVMNGSIMANGNTSAIELITKAPNKRVSISHMGGGQSFTAFDGTIGWMGNTGRPAREMSTLEAEAAGLDAEFYLPLRIKEIFQQVRGGRPEEIGGLKCDVLTGTRPGRAPVRLYFDQKSGLLMRMVRYADTPVGRNPTQIDYADYREADGVKIPFRWTLSRPNGRFTIQIAEVKSNVPVDDARFAKPAGDVR
jgi:photosynthetic reaction center cytochrome c subunit